MTFTFQTGGDSCARDQYDGWIAAFVPGRRQPVGWIDYSIWRGKVTVKIVEVIPEYRQMGLGRELVRRLLEENQLASVEDLEPTYLTREGSLLHEALLRQRSR